MKPWGLGGRGWSGRDSDTTDTNIAHQPIGDDVPLTDTSADQWGDSFMKRQATTRDRGSGPGTRGKDGAGETDLISI